MRTTLGKLRVAVMVLALLLVGGVAGFVVYGRHLMHRWAVALPKRLAKELLQESFHVSYSHSEHGKTVFTVHAAKEQKWSSGLITLDDVGIELYGRQDGATDKIHGSKFEFDQAKGLLTAVGEVYIDLAAPEEKPGQKAGAMRAADADKTLHVKTSGLVFDQKTRTARTDAGLEFQAAGLTGTAVGADYDSVSQVVVLRSTVRLSGVRNGRPVELTAAHAEIDRKANVADLREAKYVTPGESVSANTARVRLTEGGEVRGLEAQGHVTLAGSGRGTLRGDRLQVALGENGKPKDGRLWGEVQYLDREAGKDVSGTTQDLRVAFTSAGAAERAVMTGGVQMESRTPGAERSVQAGQVELALVEAAKGRVAVRQATATGNAVLRMKGDGVKGRSLSEVKADGLKAEFTGSGPAARVTRLDGVGHTSVEQIAATGVEDRSTGDTLEVEFAGAGKGTEIAHAVQRGGFQTVRTTPGKVVAGKAGAPAIERGQAAQATYDGATDRMVMSGGAQITQAGDLLQADTVTLERASGDAEAVGNVRVSYTQAAAQPNATPGEPVHVIAGRAVERKSAGTAEFFGAAGGDARMWQGGSQVLAPVLSFDRTKKTLVAHGEGAGDADVVRTVLVSTGPVSPGPASAGMAGSGTGKPGRETSGPVRVLSHTMTYLDAARQVVFAGRVRVDDQNGTLTSREATVFLAPAGAVPAKSVTASAGAFPAGQVERIVATGNVEMVQTARRAQGEELVYTAADRTFVLTGTPAARPIVTDEAQGTITGKALRFRTGDDSVQVTGGEGEAGRVRSDLRVKQR